MIINFEWWHHDLIDVQESQKEYSSAESFIGVAGPAYTYMEQGKPKGAFGMQVQWEGRAVVWAVVGNDIRNWPAFHNHVKTLMIEKAKELKINRLELSVLSDFKQGNRWARMLGFTKEAELKRFFPGGADANLWVIINEYIS